MTGSPNGGSLVDWTIIRGNLFHKHDSELKPAALYIVDTGDWYCTICKVFAPDEIRFIAELSGLKGDFVFVGGSVRGGFSV